MLDISLPENTIGKVKYKIINVDRGTENFIKYEKYEMDLSILENKYYFYETINKDGASGGKKILINENYKESKGTNVTFYPSQTKILKQNGKEYTMILCKVEGFNNNKKGYINKAIYDNKDHLLLSKAEINKNGEIVAKRAGRAELIAALQDDKGNDIKNLKDEVISKTYYIRVYKPLLKIIKDKKEVGSSIIYVEKGESVTLQADVYTQKNEKQIKSTEYNNTKIKWTIDEGDKNSVQLTSKDNGRKVIIKGLKKTNLIKVKAEMKTTEEVTISNRVNLQVQETIIQIINGKKEIKNDSEIVLEKNDESKNKVTITAKSVINRGTKTIESNDVKRTTWTTEQKDIVSIKSEDSGRKATITAKKGGKQSTAKIKVTIEYTSGKKLSKTFKIRVVETELSIDRTVLMIDNMKYNISDLTATVKTNINGMASPYTESDIEWIIDKENIAKFNKNDKKVTSTTGKEVQIQGLEFGDATITAKIKNTKISKTCKLKVISSSKEYVPGDVRFDRGEFNKRYGRKGNGGVFYYQKGNPDWGTDYVESYVNNISKLMKDYKDTKYKVESSAKTLYCYTQKDLDVGKGLKVSNGQITGVTAQTVPFTSNNSYVPGNHPELFREIIKKKAKGELSPTDYVLLFTHKNQWMYLLKRDKNNNWKVISKTKSVGGYVRDYEKNNGHQYLCIKTHYRNIGEIGFSIMRYSKNASVYQNAIHRANNKSFGIGYPYSMGCFLLPDNIRHEMFYQMFVEAGNDGFVGTRFLLF